MDFIKKHYEKILLGFVLVGLAIGAAFLPFMISKERRDLDEMQATILNIAAKPLDAQDMAKQSDLLHRTEAPAVLNLNVTNKLFNPLPWQRGADTHLIKVAKGNVGPEAVAVMKTSPLYTTITFDSATPAEGGVRYILGVEREAALKPKDRAKRQYQATAGSKNEAFVIREVKGAPEAPTELVIELNDTGEKISVSKEKPFRRVDGYMADLKYDPEKRQWLNQRLATPWMAVTLDGASYNIVAITKSEVLLSAKSNNKKHTLTFSPDNGTH